MSAMEFTNFLGLFFYTEIYSSYENIDWLIS